MRVSEAAFAARCDAAAAPDVAVSFRAAMRQLASGVCLVTHGQGEARTGLTATSVSSLSADPPTLIVCVNRASSLYAQIRRRDAFAISVLGAQHTEYADRFAARTGLAAAERFRDGDWATTPRGVSALAEALAIFECEAEEVIERHTHAILIGRVTSAASRAAEGALLYWRGGYERIGWSAEEVSRAVGMSARDGRSPLQIVS